MSAPVQISHYLLSADRSFRFRLALLRPHTQFVSFICSNYWIFLRKFVAIIATQTLFTTTDPEIEKEQRRRIKSMRQWTNRNRKDNGKKHMTWKNEMIITVQNVTLLTQQINRNGTQQLTREEQNMKTVSKWNWNGLRRSVNKHARTHNERRTAIIIDQKIVWTSSEFV